MPSVKAKSKGYILFVLALIAAVAVFAFLPHLAARTTASAVTYATSARCAVVLDANSGRIFFEKDADARRAIASTTKILTAITVLESTEDLERKVTVPDCAVGVEGSSIYLKKGETVRVVDLLYGLMLRSGNDCAVALACLTSESVEKFASAMNVVAARAGAQNSHFANPHGLPCENHFSTARDLALISAYAMRNETFRKIVSTEVYTECPNGEGESNRVMHNKNKILTMLEGGNGIKTGYTKEAGRCLVSSAERDGMRLICVVLDCGPMFEDSCKLLNAAFEESKATS